MKHPIKLGYTLSHEQYSPNVLLNNAVEAERGGFDHLWTSDHFHPWFDTNASSGFAWVWISAAAERTKKVRIGTAVTCPMFRYHPAIVAQAFATLEVMYPGRIFLALGTGEAMNEVPLGFDWPNFKERIGRLEESIKIIKLLWNENWVSFKGQYYRLKKANLYCRPKEPPMMYVGCSGPLVAELTGKYADGFLTLPYPEEYYRNVLFPALERGAREAGRDPQLIEKAIEAYVSYDEDYQTALDSVRRWASTLLPFVFKYPIADPREIESYANLVGDKPITDAWMIGTSPEQHIKHIEKYIRLGFTNIHIASSSPDELKTIKMYAKDVLPYVKSTYQE